MPLKDTIRKTKYDKENTRRIVVKLNNKYDSDIIEHFDRMQQRNESMMGYLKKLIREDMAREAQEQNDAE